LAAYLEEFDGTLMRRGTPVEKHWPTPTPNRVKIFNKAYVNFEPNFETK
jgi:hypothetical protein